MKENLKYKIPNAKEIYYFRWQDTAPYTIMAAENGKYGNLITLGYRNDLDFFHLFDLPHYNHCPFN